MTAKMMNWTKKRRRFPNSNIIIKMQQLKISNFFTVRKKRERPWDDTISPSKRMKHESIANQIFPNDILMIILKFLSFRESVELFSVACKDWRVAWKVFISN